MLLGIDVSHWQGAVNWKTVTSAGYVYAYTKATESITYTDDTLVSNVNGATSVGIPIGAYHFFRLAVDAKAQAEYFLAHTKGLNLELPPSLDFEEQASLPATQVAKNLKIWLDTVEAGCGRKPIIYTSAYYWNTYAGSPSWSSDYDLWVANYTAAPQPLLPKPWKSFLLWQYDDHGSVPGVSGNVDMNRFNGSDEQLARLAGRASTPPDPQPTTLEQRVKALEEQVLSLQQALKDKGG